MTGRIIRFEALTAAGDVFEGYAHNADEARQKVKEQTPEGTDFEIFFGSSVPQRLTLEQFRQCRQLGLPEGVIRLLDQRLDSELDDLDNSAFDAAQATLNVVLEFGLIQREQYQR